MIMTMMMAYFSRFISRRYYLFLFLVNGLILNGLVLVLADMPKVTKAYDMKHNQEKRIQIEAYTLPRDSLYKVDPDGFLK